jgi:hypothetical protein
MAAITRKEMFVDEKVFVKYLPDLSNGITDKTHPEYGGLSNNARIGICAPVSTRRINDIFSEDELRVLAEEFNDPTLVRGDSDFWKEYITDKYGMSQSIFPIFLKKEGALYNKKNPIDYIYIRVLEDSESLGGSVEEAKVKKCKFALIKEKDEFKKEKVDISSAKSAFKLYNKYDENEDVLRYLLSNISKPVSATVGLEFLQRESWKEMNARPVLFAKILEDEFLETKIKITHFLRYKLINKVNSLYYFEKGEPITFDGVVADMQGAASYLGSGVGQEALLSLEAKLAILTKKVK